MPQDQDTRALQEELRKLRQDLTVTRQKVDRQEKAQLKYPLDANSQSVFNQLFDLRLKNVLMDTTWKRVFRWFEPFGSIANWQVSVAGTPGVRLFQGSLHLETSAVAGNEQFAFRINNNWNTTNTFDRDSYMRMGCAFGGTDSNSNSIYYLTIGVQQDDEGFYGFKAVNGSLYGVFSPKGTEEEVLTNKLLDIVEEKDPLKTHNTYLLEARYYAGVKVDFFVTINSRGLPAEIASVPSATIRSTITIPVELIISLRAMFGFYIKTTAAEVKVMNIFDIDYIQKLDVQ